MGGRLEVVSTPGRGSTFSLVIPRVRPADSAAAPAVVPAPAAAPQTAVRSILIADDVPLNLMVLKAQLNRIGSFRIETAPDGAVALERLRKAGNDPFDLVLTDIWMPVLDGEGLVRAIRADPALRPLRVVAVTADVEFPAKSAAVGFDGVFLKPVTTENLASALSVRR